APERRHHPPSTIRPSRHHLLWLQPTRWKRAVVFPVHRSACAPLIMTLNVFRERPCRSPMFSQLWVIGFSPFSRQHLTLPRHRLALQPLLAPLKLLRPHSASELDELSIVIEKSHDFGC